MGSAGATGAGEENIKVAGAHTIVENMRHGMSPKEACLDAFQRELDYIYRTLQRLGTAHSDVDDLAQEVH